MNNSVFVEDDSSKLNEAEVSAVREESEKVKTEVSDEMLDSVKTEASAVMLDSVKTEVSVEIIDSASLLGEIPAQQF